MAQSASKSCDICMSGPGHNYCEQCDQWMCENCKTLHLRSKISINHTFLSGQNINPEEKLLCKEHNENFIFYCNDCDIPICKMCIVKKHKKHDTSEINESTQELQAEVERVIDSKIKSVKTNLDKIEQGTGKYQSDVKEAIRVITEDGKQMKQWIEKKVQALITSLEEKETANVKVFQSIRTGLQNDLEKFQKCQTAFTESQKVTEASKLLTQLKHIKSELDVSDEKQPPVMPTMKYNKKNVSEREIFNLFGDISFQ
ncbi:TRIM45 [Mytilus coruscus]|uniref:TRIM45 n=1 Tax=Mytilus coruscus TaxID=42192 RepID=A0A6J8B577_MYTCO|nr:TRIM45 [Mytilus coruscus]